MSAVLQMSGQGPAAAAPEGEPRAGRTSRRKVIVAMSPPAVGLGGDKLFYGDGYVHVGDASHWMEPFHTLAAVGRSRGIEFHTSDVVDLDRAAVFVFGEMPASRHEVAALRRQYPRLKIVLHILESPLGRDWIFRSQNHSDFDAVVSYHPELDDGARYHSFKLPIGGLNAAEIPSGRSWEERKVACLVAHVPNVRPLLVRRSGLHLVMRSGWKLTPRTWWNYVTEGGSLYGERLAMAEDCQRLLGGQFDIFGPGWPELRDANGRPRFASARGPYRGSKLELLQNYRFNVAYENCRNDCGYISEKLFDALLAGCVPVYLGNRSILDHVPEQAFVDARKFRARSDLIEHLRSMAKDEWETMRHAGAAFLRTEAAPLFGSMQYARCVLGTVDSVLH